jgi:hypothetical protein
MPTNLRPTCRIQLDTLLNNTVKAILTTTIFDGTTALMMNPAKFDEFFDKPTGGIK